MEIQENPAIHNVSYGSIGHGTIAEVTPSSFPQNEPYRSASSAGSSSELADDDEDSANSLWTIAYHHGDISSDDDKDDESDCAYDVSNQSCDPAAKPLCLMEDWELWDYMDAEELAEHLKDRPQLLAAITLKRKRAELDDSEEWDDVCETLRAKLTKRENTSMQECK